MGDLEIKTRQEQKGKGKFNKKHKECYNTKRVRQYENKIATNLMQKK